MSWVTRIGDEEHDELVGSATSSHGPSLRVFGHPGRSVPGPDETRRFSMVGGFSLRKAPWDELVRLAEAAYPREACGILLGERAGRTWYAHAFHPAANIAASPDRFDLDPAALVRAEDLGRAAGLEVVAVWHSHPDAPAHPSEEDLRTTWREVVHVITEVRDGARGETTAWWLGAQSAGEASFSDQS